MEALVVYAAKPATALVGIPSIYFLWCYFQGSRFTKPVRIDGKVAIVTGANAGLGRETALDFAGRGAHVYMACRNTDAGRVVRDEIAQRSGNENVFVLKLDLSSMQSVREFAAEFQKREQNLHLLINNAGMPTQFSRRTTVDGHEIQFATNHLGHFLLTTLLLDTMKASAPARIVTVSSLGHAYATINRDDINLEKSYSASAGHRQSKLANILFTRELAKRLAGTGVTANSVSPGGARTSVQGHYPLILRVLAWPFLQFFLKSAEGGAQTQITVALDPELKAVSGKYFSDCRVTEEAKVAQDDEMAQWLWAKSEEMAGLRG